VHFHPSGKPETEKSLIGIYFSDRPPDKNLMSLSVPTLFGVGAGIDIPAGTKDYTIKESFTLPGDVKVYSAGAHAHYLARQMIATATLPDGSTRSLLRIKDWDFNWQDGYVFKQPFTLPKGTRIDATITYDNSAENPRNPISPPRRAVFGEQSFDEMGAVLLDFEVMNKADLMGGVAAVPVRSGAIAVSAITGEGLEALAQAIDQQIAEGMETAAYDIEPADGARLAWLYQHGEVMDRRDDDDAVRVTVRLLPADRARFESRT